MPRTDPARRAQYQREFKLRKVRESGTHPCACGCGTMIPRIKFNGSPRFFAVGHLPNKRQPGDTRLTAAGYIMEYAPKHPTARNGWVAKHRLIWERAHGPLPAGAQIHHRNGVRHDNRLANLQRMDPREHQLIHWRERWRGVIPCLDPEHLERPRTSVLNAEEVVEIRRRILDGEPQDVLAREFTVSASAISRLWHGKTWPCRICDWPGSSVASAGS